MLLVLPVLLVILLGTVEFALWLAAQQQTTLASREGARVAATGGSADDVNAAVGLVLGSARLQQAQVTTVLTNSAGNPALPGEPVSVQVQLPTSAVVPDLLIFTGISIKNQVLVSQTVMRKE
jgi:Flp pilus assembly protein TadG